MVRRRSTVRFRNGALEGLHVFVGALFTFGSSDDLRIGSDIPGALAAPARWLLACVTGCFVLWMSVPGHASAVGQACSWWCGAPGAGYGGAVERVLRQPPVDAVACEDPVQSADIAVPVPTGTWTSNGVRPKCTVIFVEEHQNHAVRTSRKSFQPGRLQMTVAA
jgi:hypothetical protein